MSDSESDDDDYEVYGESHHSIRDRRYPLHDCCEFEDVDALRVSSATMVTYRCVAWRGEKRRPLCGWCVEYRL